MMMKINYIAITLLIPLCAGAVEIRTEMNTSYRKSGQVQPQVLNAGQSVNIAEGEQLIFSGENQLPLLVIAAGAKDSVVTIKKETSQDLIREATLKSINSAVGEIVAKLLNVEVMIKNKSFVQAKNLLQDLKDKYPQVSSVHFASGTTNFLMNNRTLAIADLEKGLTIDPENNDAKKLLERIKRDK
jgi:predicted Zn-dependent protease